MKNVRQICFSDHAEFSWTTESDNWLDWLSCQAGVCDENGRRGDKLTSAVVDDTPNKLGRTHQDKAN